MVNVGKYTTHGSYGYGNFLILGSHKGHEHITNLSFWVTYTLEISRFEPQKREVWFRFDFPFQAVVIFRWTRREKIQGCNFQADKYAIQGTITYPTKGKRKIMFNIVFSGDMLVPRRVYWSRGPTKTAKMQKSSTQKWIWKRDNFLVLRRVPSDLYSRFRILLILLWPNIVDSAEVLRINWFGKYPIILQGFIHVRWLAGFLNHQQYGSTLRFFISHGCQWSSHHTLA